MTKSGTSQQFRRGTTVQNEQYVGRPAEPTVDIETNQLRIHDGVTPGGFVVGGTSSFADTASLALNNIQTASVLASTITFTKGNGITFDITVSQSGSIESASYAEFAESSISSSYALQSDTASKAISASHALFSDTASAVLVISGGSITGQGNYTGSLFGTASYAITASHALNLGAGTGTVTSIEAGSGLTGGIITSSGTITLDTSSVHFSGGVNIYAPTLTGTGATGTWTITASRSISSSITDAVGIISGGSITGQGNYTGSFFGTASHAITASYALNANDIILPPGVVSSSAQAADWTVATASVVPGTVLTTTNQTVHGLKTFPTGVSLATGNAEGRVLGTSFHETAIVATNISYTSGDPLGSSAWRYIRGSGSNSTHATALISRANGNTGRFYFVTFPLSTGAGNTPTSASTVLQIDHDAISTAFPITSTFSGVGFIGTASRAVSSSITDTVGIINGGSITGQGNYTGSFSGTASYAVNSLTASYALNAGAAVGTVTSITAGSGLTGGIITSSGTISLNTGSTHFTTGTVKALPAGTVSASSQVNHDSTTGFVANEHIDHSSVNIAAGSGLSGGGTIAASRTLSLNTGSTHFTNGVVRTLPAGTVSASSQVDHDSTTNFVANEHINHTSVSITAGSGLSGGGTIAATRTLSLNTGSTHFSTGVNRYAPTLSGSGATGTWEINITGQANSAITATSAGSVPWSGVTSKPSGLVSSSSQIDHNATSNYSAFEHIDHGSLLVTAGNGLSGGGSLETSITVSLNTGSTHFTNGTIRALPAGTVSASSQVNHDSTTGFVANEHINHTAVSMSAGDGLTGGGTIATSRTFAVDTTVVRTSGTQTIGGAKTFTSNVTIADSIIHSGDTNTTIRFPANDTVTISTNGSERVRVDSSGRVGINNSSPTYTLDVIGDVRVSSGSIGVGTTPNATDGRVDAVNDITSFSSDRRLKTDVIKITSPVEKVQRLSGFTYCWNDLANNVAGFNTSSRYAGVYAQEVQEVLPEAVKLAPFDNNGKDESVSGKNYLTVQYEKLIPLLIEAIKEQQTQIDYLKSIVEKNK